MSSAFLALSLPVALLAQTAPQTGPAPSDVPVAQTPAASSTPLPPDAPATAPLQSVHTGSSEIVVSARQHIEADPVEAVNVVSFKAVQAVDIAFVAPVSRGYKKGLPEPVRDGLHNAINNLDEPVVFVNFLLQHNVGKAVETAGRFLLNSTVGLAGLIDVAKRRPINLPRRGNGLADTMGFYGIGSGPYLFLPIIGSTTVRDLFGRIVDLSLLPAVAGSPFNKAWFTLTKGTISALDYRVRNDEKIESQRDTGDAYGAMRDAYLKDRQAHIDELKGKKPSGEKGETK